MRSVDLVIPCYNYARFLSQCVNSVLEQDGVEVRGLIIDDCSSDNSEQVLSAPDSVNNRNSSYSKIDGRAIFLTLPSIFFKT
jgi:glycosyltransferase involved in cell wall biosynthesis